MIGISDILKLTKQLYPTGRAFNLKPGSIFEKLHTGLGQSELRAWQDANAILNSILPDNDNFTTDDATQWEIRLGLITNTSISLADRKAAILRKMNHPGSIKARQNYLYVQDQLQTAGFNVNVFENRFQNSALPGLNTFTNISSLGGSVNWSLGSSPNVTLAVNGSSKYLAAVYRSPGGITYSINYTLTKSGANPDVTIGFLDSDLTDLGHSTFTLSGSSSGSVSITPSSDTFYIYVYVQGVFASSTTTIDSLSISPIGNYYTNPPSVYGIPALPSLNNFLNYTGPGAINWGLGISPSVSLAGNAQSKYLYAAYFCPAGYTYTINYDITKTGANPDITFGFLDNSFTPVISTTFTVTGSMTGSIQFKLISNAAYIYVYIAGVFSTSFIIINSLTINSFGNSYDLIANNISSSIDNLFDPGDDFRSTFFICGNTVGSLANIDASREDEFRQLILKLKPCQTVAFAFVQFI
jgi:hypothetical protein